MGDESLDQAGTGTQNGGNKAHTIRDLQQELDALRADLENAKRDTERLDWLLGALSRRILRELGVLPYSEGSPDAYREAIDTAMR